MVGSSKSSTYIDLKREFNKKLGRTMTKEEDEFLQWMAEKHEGNKDGKPIKLTPT